MRAGVVGAGPAGSVAALALAESCDEVKLFEEHERHHKNHAKCAGLLSKSGLRRVGIKLEPEVVLNEVRGALIHEPFGECFEVLGRETKAFVVDRLSFDEMLREMCLAEGVELVHKRVLAEDVSSLLGNDVLVLATGVDYGLHRALGIPTPSEFLVASQLTLRLECDSELVELHFDDGCFFNWVVPLDENTARVGVCDRKSPQPRMRTFLKSLAAAGRLKRCEPLERVFGVIPIHNPRLRTEHFGGKVRLVGDSASHVKASTGGGVIFGCLAAKLVASPDYEKAWRIELGGELLLHLLIHRYFRSLSREEKRDVLKIIAEEREKLESGDMDLASLTLRELGFRALLKLVSRKPLLSLRLGLSFLREASRF